MALKPAICTQCGGQIQVDDSKEAGICPNCGTAFITEKVIQNITNITQNSFAGATINVQNGPDIDNLYKLARRATEAGKSDDIIKYYGLIREQNPDDWEAEFFISLYDPNADFEKGTVQAMRLLKESKLDSEAKEKHYGTMMDEFLAEILVTRPVLLTFGDKEQVQKSRVDTITWFGAAKNMLIAVRNELLEADVCVDDSLYLVDYKILEICGKLLTKEEKRIIIEEFKRINPKAELPESELIPLSPQKILMYVLIFIGISPFILFILIKLIILLG